MEGCGRPSHTQPVPTGLLWRDHRTRVMVPSGYACAHPFNLGCKVALPAFHLTSARPDASLATVRQTV
jgi:hypothetical protein